MNMIKKIMNNYHFTFQLHTELCPVSPDRRAGDAIHPVLRGWLVRLLLGGGYLTQLPDSQRQHASFMAETAYFNKNL